MYDDDGTDAICYFVITIPDIVHDNMEEEGSEGAKYFCVMLNIFDT